MDNPDAVKHETVMDTGAEQLGKTYAQALLGAAEKAGKIDLVVDQLVQLVDTVLAENPQLAAAFASPRIEVVEKCSVIDKLFGESLDPLLVTFLKVMAGRERLGFLGAVSSGAIARYDEMAGRVLAKVTSAVALDDASRSSITQTLEKALGKTVRLEESVDESLLGGLVIRVGDTVFDSSVANQLDVAGKRLRSGFSSKLVEHFDQMTAN